jgi:hypothetical protein
MSANTVAIPHHDAFAEFAEPHRCLQLFFFKYNEQLPTMYFNLVYSPDGEAGMSDYIELLTINHVQAWSVIFKRRPEGFLLCRN